MSRIDEVYNFLKNECKNFEKVSGLSADYIARMLGFSRCNVSNDLNRLHEQGKVRKIKGKPVLFIPCEFSAPDTCQSTRMHDKISIYTDEKKEYETDVFEAMIGHSGSLKAEIEKAKAAVLYPPSGLTTMILGPTGVGKTMFANLMYKYAVKMGMLKPSSKFIAFNCADYANNPNLIMAQLFGYVKGSFTGADKDKEGLVEKAHQGVLFLDEVHRLPPEAQEMLFYLMDSGTYRRLGEVESIRKANPFIILATTENPDSVLLKTFQRRIPVIIKLPSLNERGIVERLNLIEEFLVMEAIQLKLPVYINSTVIKAFLSYDCPGNMGQLKSDLKLVCARAYMNFITGKRKNVTITIDDLPEYIKEGLLKVKDRYSEVNFLSCNLEVKPDSNKGRNLEYSYTKSLYDLIEERYDDYLKKGFEVTKIELYLANDIENYYNSLISRYRINKNFRQEELLKIVSEETILILRKSLELIEKGLNIKIRFEYSGALALHINSAVERVRSGKQIKNPKLQNIKNQFPDIYPIALQIVDIMKNVTELDFPDDEAGYIAKLINCIINRNMHENEVGLVVVAHGEGSAKSMAAVANRLLGQELVKWYDMSLDESPEKSLECVTQLVIQANRQKGVLLLVDMGSLVSFGDIISCKTGIPVKTIHMVSTPMVVEAAHMAHNPDSTLDQIYINLTESEFFTVRDSYINASANSLPKVLLTICVTGQGTAQKLKEIIEGRFDFHYYIEVIALDVGSFSEFDYKVKSLLTEKDIVSIVGVTKPKGINVPFISIEELLFGEGFKRLANILKKYGVTEKEESTHSGAELLSCERSIELKLVSEALTNYLNFLDGQKLLPHVTKVIREIERARGNDFERGKFITLFIHICCMIERLIFDRNGTEKSGKVSNDNVKFSMMQKMGLKDIVGGLESVYNIKIPQDELIGIYDIIQM